MKLMSVDLNDSSAYSLIIINVDLITRMDANTNFVALADGSELIITDDSMKRLLINMTDMGE